MTKKQKPARGWNMVEVMKNLSPDFQLARTAMGTNVGPLLWDARRIEDRDAAALDWFLRDLGWWPLFRIERGWDTTADHGFDSPLPEDSTMDLAGIALEKRKGGLGWRWTAITSGFAGARSLVLIGVGYALEQLGDATAALLVAVIIAIVLGLIRAGSGLLRTMLD